MRAVHRPRGHVGAPEDVHDLRAGGLLRFFEEQTRPPARRRRRTSHRPLGGAGGGLDVVLRRREARDGKPVILAVDDDPGGLERVERELRKRYEADYGVVCEGSAEAGLEKLRGLAAAGEDVAVVLASQRMSEMTGVEFLTRAHQIFPTEPSGWP